jgi:hypothetical protein
MDAADNVIIDGFIFTGAVYDSSREGGLIDTLTTEEPIATEASSAPQRRLAISTTSSTVKTLHSTLSSELSDITGGRGGGIFSNGTNITVVNSIFYENLAVKGGALYCIGYSDGGALYKSPTITNVAFIHNVAVRGGAIMGDVYCEFECESCIFDSNIASEKGGAIYLDYFCDISVNNSQFLNNVAHESGGCVANDGFSYVLLSNDLFSNNDGKWEAGCLYGGSHISYSGTIFYIVDSTFENNTAKYGFGDIWLWADDGIVLKENEEQTSTLTPMTTSGQIMTTNGQIMTTNNIRTTKFVITEFTTTEKAPIITETTSGATPFFKKINILLFVTIIFSSYFIFNM